MRVLATLALAITAVVAFQQQPEQDSPVMLVQGQVPLDSAVNDHRALESQLEETNQVKDGKDGRRLGFWTGAAGGVLGAAGGRKIGQHFGGRNGGRAGAALGAVGGAVFGSKLNFRGRSRSRSRRSRSRSASLSPASYTESGYGSPQQRGGRYGQGMSNEYGNGPQSRGQYSGEQEY